MIHPFDLEALEDRLQRLLAAEAVRTGARQQDRVQPDTMVGPATPVTETVRMTGGGGGAP
jgi:hypothetical protein